MERVKILANGEKIFFQVAPQRKTLLRSFTEYFLKNDGISATEDNRDSLSGNSSPNGQDDLFKCLRPLLRFGRIIGMIPISGLFHLDSASDSISFKKKSLASITSVLIIAAMIVHTGVRVVIECTIFRAGGASNLNQIAESVASVIFAITGAYIYYFMYSTAPKLIACLCAWRQHKQILPHLGDHRLQRNVNLVAGILLTSAIVQNALTHYNVLPGSKVSKLSLLETYYSKHFPHYSDVLPYNPIAVIFLFICDKWCVYAWTFGDILVAVIARAFYKQFQLHSEQVQREIQVMKYNRQFWKRVLDEYQMIVELLEKFNAFLRPLIFACVASNIYFIAITLDRFLVSSPSVAPPPPPSTTTSPSLTNEKEKLHLILLAQINSVWSFLQLLAKTFTSIEYCARVSSNAHDMEDILHKCPQVAYTKEVERIELKLRTKRIGFQGLDYFIITKPFVLAACNVVFTLEIVLLQSAAASSST